MHTIPKANSYGGVLISRARKVLLVEPAGHFGGYAWTFPKGRPDKGEAPSDTALREAREESGYRAEILAALPQPFPGTKTTSAYFLMGPLGQQGAWDAETASTRWVDVEEAERLIGETKTQTGRARDLAILRAAAAAMDTLPWDRRPATCREDWQAHPMPRRRTTLALDRLYDARAAQRIRKGWFPMAMEEKWFTWWDAPVLHLHRSWTGFCNYEVTLVPEGDGLRAISVVANRDPEQYGETDDGADLSLLTFVMDDLFIEAPDAPTTDAFAEALALASQPNYLGSPEVVSGLLQSVIEAAVGYVRGGGDFNGAWNTIWELSQEVATGSSYTRMPGWHTPDALGRHLARTFGFWCEPSFADDLGYFVSEALGALFLRVRDLLLGFVADRDADWDTHALPQLNALHAWATTVFLGTDAVTQPGATVADFRWQATSN